MNDKFNKIETKSGIKIAFGLVFIIIGAVLLGFNTGIIPAYFWNMLVGWQSILILIGFVLLFGRNSKMSGIVLIVIGGAFLIPEFTGLQLHFFKHIFPLLIILLGLSILFKRRKNAFIPKKAFRKGAGFLDETAIFSGSEIVFTDDDFRGGTITAVFGGYHLDLTKTHLPLGTTFLEIEAIFGGVEVVVSNSWKVTSKVSTVFGAVEDKRHNAVISDNERELIITGTAIFGSIEIKSY
jgi:predicted membrane protein